MYNRRSFLKIGSTAAVGFGVVGGPTTTQVMAQSDITEIEDWFDLDSVRDNLNSDYILTSDLNETSSGYDDLVADPDSGWDPIGNYETNSEDVFNGTFNGDGHVISGLQIDRPSVNAVGLFAIVGNTEIQNIGLENADVIGGEGVSGLAGRNDARIINSFVTGEIGGIQSVGGLCGINNGTIVDSYSTADVNGDRRVGGLIGNIALSQIRNSRATGEVTGKEDVGGLIGLVALDSGVSGSFATGVVDGNSRTGGLVGRSLDSEITESYATGEVNGSDEVGGLAGQDSGLINSSYATGRTSGNTRVGGVIGYCSQGTTTGVYAAGPVEGEEQVGGLVGRLSSESTGGLTDSDAIIQDCYWDTQVTGQTDAVGEVTEGRNSAVEVRGEVLGLETTEMQGETAAERMSSFNFEDMWVAATGADSYPLLYWQDQQSQNTKESVDEGDNESDQSNDGGNNSSVENTTQPGVDQAQNERESENESSSGATENETPGFGIGTAIVSITSTGYIIKKWVANSYEESG